MAVDRTLITIALELPGQRVVRNLGIVRGITVRSRSRPSWSSAPRERTVAARATQFHSQPARLISQARPSSAQKYLEVASAAVAAATPMTAQGI